jgi:electron transport complex protein RnfC
MPCIRCAKCVEVCPANLLPQQLYWYASSQSFDRVIEYHLFDCIECGCCSYVCPSQIPLVQYYRFAKSEIWEQEYNHKQSNIARERHESRVIRLDNQKREREERSRKKREMLNKKKGGPGKSEMDVKKDTIAEALARVKKKKEDQSVKPKNMDNLTTEQQLLIKQADERRANKNKRKIDE